VVANTSDAKQANLAERYGFGCVSIEVRKSAAPEKHFADSTLSQLSGLVLRLINKPKGRKPLQRINHV
jgi:hypothetical protein